MTDQPSTRWQSLTGGAGGAEYAARFDALAASGRDVHGEASFCAVLLAPPGPVLDAGCGTGRVAVRLQELGYDVVGVDVDASMLQVARAGSAEVAWHEADLASLRADHLGGRDGFPLVVLAGNVVPLLAPGTGADAVRAMAGLLAPGGLLVAGFGLHRAHLPAGCPVTSLAEYDAEARAAGLALVERFSTWDRNPFLTGSRYAVSVHRRRGGAARRGASTAAG